MKKQKPGYDLIFQLRDYEARNAARLQVPEQLIRLWRTAELPHHREI